MPSFSLFEKPQAVYLTRYTPDPKLPPEMNSRQFFVTPETIKKVIEVDWVSIVVPGLSHEVLQYSHTKNLVLSGLEFMVSRAAYRGDYSAIDASDDLVDNFGRFFEQFCYSDPANATKRLDSPDRMVFLVPAPANPSQALIFLICVLTRFETEYTQYDTQGRLVHAKYIIDLQEIRDVRYSATQAASLGSVRANALGYL
jgi:hypothetical protein